MQTRDEFLAGRMRGLGGTDVAAILNTSKFKSPVDVYLEKTGRSKKRDEMSIPQEFGIFAEDFVAQKYQDKTGRIVVRYNKQIEHALYPFLIGNVDRLVVPEGEKVAHHMGVIRTDRGVEAKCVSAFSGGEWGDDDSDEVPTAYYIQCQWYMGLTGCPFWDLAALIGNHRFAIFPFTRDAGLIQDAQAVAIRFWTENVLSDVAPPPRSEADVAALFPKSEEGRKVAASDDVQRQLELVRKLREKEAEAKADLEAARIPVKLFMEKAEALILSDSDGKTLATWKNNKDSTVVDYESAFNELVRKCEIYKVVSALELLAMKKEIIAKYSKAKLGERKFLIK